MERKMIFILLFITLSCSVCETFKVRSTKSSCMVFKNEDVKLEWTFTEGFLDSLQISCHLLTDRNSSVLLEYVKGEERPLYGPFRGRVQLDKDLLREGRIRLHVSSLRTEDSGHYRCKVKTSEEISWDSCHVNVTETFEVRSAQCFYQVFKNKDITLDWTFTNSSLDSLHIICHVFTDHNHPVLLVYVKGVEISHHGPFWGRVQLDKDLLREGRIRLYVSSLRTEESGDFKCDVKTSKGSDSASCHVHVTETFEVRPAQSFYQGFKNEDITLEWTFPTSSLDSLHISCHLLTDHNSSILLENVKGFEISQYGVFGGRVQLDNDLLREGRIRFHVSSLRTEDSGRYQCDVKTREGSGLAFCHVNVTETFEIRPAQSFYQGFKNEDITLEWTFPTSSLNSLHITCYLLTDRNSSVLLEYVKGEELPQHGLFRGRVQLDKNLLREGRIRFHVSSLRTEDSGHYHCEVKTRDGYGFASCHVNVTAELQTTLETEPETEDRKPGIGGRIGLSLGLPALVIFVVCGTIFLRSSRRRIRLCYFYREKTGGKNADRITNAAEHEDICVRLTDKTCLAKATALKENIDQLNIHESSSGPALPNVAPPSINNLHAVTKEIE